MPLATDQEARSWPFARRDAAAMTAVLDQGWTIVSACKFYGLDKTSFGKRLRRERQERGLPATKREESKMRAEKQERMGPKLAEPPIPLPPVVHPHAPPGRPLDDQRPRLPTDINEFNERYFGHFICPDCDERHPSPEFHKELFGVCQDPGVFRGLVLTPPYHAKTTVVTVRDTIYDIAHDRNSRTMIISETKPFAQDILGGIKNLLQNPAMYEGARGNLIEEAGVFFEPGTTWNNEQIIVVGRQTSEIAPTVQVLGYRGQIYGRRADKIKMDDVASFLNQANPDAVEQMLKWIDSQVLSRIGRKARCIFIGTRVRPGDIYETLQKRDGYDVIRFSAIVNEDFGEMLWPEHFPLDFAKVRRAEMDQGQWELVYQNVDQLSVGMSFTKEVIETAKDPSRAPGHHEPGWFLIGGIDLAGGGERSGYTAFTLVGVDPASGKFHLIDAYREKSMKAPDLKKKIMDWSNQYPIYEWRVENNGVQSQIVQYNEDIIIPLGARGIRVEGHNTNSNKWDEEFGVETMAPMLGQGAFTIPMGKPHEHIETLMRELRGFPLDPVNDLVMSLWFAVLGGRAIIHVPALPLFDERSTRRFPKRIRRGRHLVDFANQAIDPVPLYLQDSRFHNEGHRQTSGRPTLYPEIVEEPQEREFKQFVNVEGGVYVDRD